MQVGMVVGGVRTRLGVVVPQKVGAGGKGFRRGYPPPNAWAQAEPDAPAILPQPVVIC